jgi:hypothetical protein
VSGDGASGTATNHLKAMFSPVEYRTIGSYRSTEERFREAKDGRPGPGMNSGCASGITSVQLPSTKMERTKMQNMESVGEGSGLSMPYTWISLGYRL